MSLSFRFTAVNIIPDDILLEILARLPSDSVTRFKCVSKLWSSLISSRYFIDLFYKISSSTKLERRVFVYTSDYMLFSSRISNLDATTSLFQLNRDRTLPGNDDCLEFVNALRGLMCFRVDRYKEMGDTQIHIINFTTRQALSLPLVESNILLGSGDYYAWNYFGYDPVNDEYKVLSIISSLDISETQDFANETTEFRFEIQLFVLGDETSWRNTKSLTSSPPPHYLNEGISINGVLYYGAWSHEDRCYVLMSFDFNSEEFNLIEFPMEALSKWNRLDQVKVMNYRDKVAAFDDSRLYTECILDLWMLEGAGKSKWSHKIFDLPFHQIRETLQLNIYDLDIKGTSRSGELTLCGEGQVNRNNKSAHAFYDLEKNRITRVVVFEPPHRNYNYVQMNLWEDVESIMYLEA